MDSTVSKLVLDITNELIKYKRDRERLSEETFDFFDGEVEGLKLAIAIVARVSSRS